MKTKFNHSVLILFFTFSLSKINAQNTWLPLNGPSGGPVYDIITGNAVYDFCITPAGMYRTSNNGNLWTQSSPLTISNLYVGASDNQGNIIAATTNYTTLLYRSTDNGNSWQQQLDGGLDFNAVVTSPNGTIFAGTFYMFSFHGQFIQDGEIFRSVNNGETWSSVNFPPLAVVSMKANSNAEIFVATTDGLFRSANNGSSFSNIRSGSTGSLFINSQNHIFIQSLNSLLRSTDNGSTWTSIGSGGDFKSPIAEDAAGNLFAGYSGDLYRSTDNGTSWSLFADLPDNSINEISSIRFKTGGSILVSTSKGIFRSDDNGVTWIKVNAGLRDPQVKTITVNGNNIFTASYNSISRSLDNGNTWRELTNGLPGYYAKEIVTGSGANVFASISAGGLYRSLNNGDSWSIVQSLPANLYISNIKKGNGNKIYITAENGSILKSDNNGDSWTSIVGNLPDSLQFLDLSLDHQNNLYVSVQRSSWVTPLNGIYKSTNEGDTWTAVNNEISPEDMIINSQGIFFAKFGTSIIKSEDGGMNFSPLTSTQEYVIDYIIGSSDEIYMHSVNNEIYKISKSVDNGATWTDHTGILQNQLVYDLQTDVNSKLLAATQSGLYRLDNATGVILTQSNIPDKYSLEQNYPNPFNPVTVIRYSILESRFINLKVYDVLGSEVKTLVNEKKNPGSYSVTFDGGDLSSGVYFYRLEAGNYTDVKRMILIK